MKKISKRLSWILGFVLFALYSCDSNQSNAGVLHKSELYRESIAQTNRTKYSRGYELMQQKCFICHMKTPDPAKRNTMIAPPMVRVQEHYKSVYPAKQDFMKAAIAFVQEPSEASTLMPGAIRKFGLMARLPYETDDLELIAEALYYTDFGKISKQRMCSLDDLQLDKGMKWKLFPRTWVQVAEIQKQLRQFQSNEVSEYQKLGRTIFNQVKPIVLDDAYKGAILNQIHTFFHSIEEPIHLLIASKSRDEAHIQLQLLKKRFETFTAYFEKYSI